MFSCKLARTHSVMVVNALVERAGYLVIVFCVPG